MCDSHWETFFYLGKVYLELDDKNRGVKCLRKSCSLKKTFKNVELICHYLSAEETLLLLQDYQKSYNISKNPFFQFRIGFSNMELGRYTEAVRIFQKLFTAGLCISSTSDIVKLQDTSRSAEARSVAGALHSRSL